MKEKKHVHSLVHNREFWMMLAILTASLVLRLNLIRIDRVVRWDEPDYLILGQHLFTGQGYTVSGRPELHYAPLFPVIVGLLYPFTHNMKLNSDICFVLFGTIMLWPFYWLAKRLFGVRVAVMATALLCFFPPLTASVLFWGTMIEPLYLFLLYAGLCAVWNALERKALPSYWLAGVLFGLAYLTKPEAIIYFGLMFALLILVNLRRHALLARSTIAGVLGGMVAFALVVSPYVVFLYRHTGRVIISGKLGVTYVAGQGAVEHDPGLYDRALSRLDEAGEEIIWFSTDRFKYSIWDSIKASPKGFVRRVWQNVNTLERALFARQVFPFYFLVPVGLGWFGSAWDRRRTVKELFLVASVLPLFIFLPFHIELRYFAPLLPVLLLWLAKGLEALADWLRCTWMNLHFSAQRTLSQTCLSALLSAPVLLYFLLLQPIVLREGLAGMNTSRREAGLWLKANSPAHSMVMSRDTEVPFYAERRWAATPNEEYPRFIAYIRHRGANYLVVDEREVTVIRPQLRLLLNEDSPPPGLRHVYTAYDPAGKTIIYEVMY